MALQGRAAELDLGNHVRIVSTQNEEAQRCFNMGLNQNYGFNHEDAIRWFLKALEADNQLAIAHWGISHAYDWNYNNPEGLKREEAAIHAKKALELIEFANDSEAAIIKAIQTKFVNDMKSDEAGINQVGPRVANEMRKVYEQFPNDSDIAALFAEALMNLRPWQLWHKDEKGNILETTLEAQIVLESSLKKYPNHPGLLHMYIHLMELSPNPSAALIAANTLEKVCPEQGHMIHMPSHIYMWQGDYLKAIQCNEDAIIADKKYVQLSGVENEFYKMYRLHNIHFCCWASMYDGQYEKALQTARAMQSELTVAHLTSDPGVNILEGFNCIVLHVFIRFGKWNEILQEPIPEDKDLFAMTQTTSYYARGLAYAALGDIEKAEIEKENFLNSLENPVVTKRLMINNYAYRGDDGIFHIAREMLFGEIEYRKCNFDDAFSFLREAVKRCDLLTYDEPWGWMIPPRHALAALLLEQNYIHEAIDVYNEDLKTYKNNLWSLTGLLLCLQKLSSCPNEINKLEEKLKEVSARADFDPTASCFCAVSAGAVAPKCCKK